jgi:endonuclease/exonuclease/phosphatase family metal-dependent hydrolase
MEWFAGKGYPQMQQSIRTEQDLTLMAQMFESISPEVFAFQEVNSKQALDTIVGDEYTIYLSERALPSNKNHQFNGINQYTGLAIKKDWLVSNQSDLNLNSSSHHKLRFATYVTAQPPKSSAPPIHILSVHLKAGCRAAYKNNRSCEQLKEQTDKISSWVKERSLNKQPFIILGDFNHDITYAKDWMWKSLSEGANHSISIASINTPADCLVKSRSGDAVFKYRTLIDHIVTSHSLTLEQVKQEIFEENAVINHNLSDHCPLVASLIVD